MNSRILLNVIMGPVRVAPAAYRPQGPCERSDTLRTARALLWAGILFGWAAVPGSAVAGEVEIAARMVQDCTVLLDQLLGPGKAKVFIQIQGEQAEVKTQKEFVTPVKSTATSAALPGFGVSRYLDKTFEFLERDYEQSTRIRSFAIQRIDVSVVLDEKLPTQQVNAVRRILSDMLRLDMSRGDNLVVIRAPLMPVWKEALFSTEGYRAGAMIAGAGAVLLLIAVLILFPGYFLALRAVRLFGNALAQRGYPETGMGAMGPMPQAFPAAAPGVQEAQLVGEGPGGIPRMGMPPEALAEAPGGTPQLGQRFGFFESRKPEELSQVLKAETPEDLALLFGHLADSNPTQASFLFAALPQALQIQVSQALLGLEVADPERLAMLEDRLRALVESLVRGPDKLGSIFSRLPSEQRGALMGELASANPAGSEKVAKSMVAFEDLLGLKIEDLRRLLSGVPYQEWAVALRGLAPALTDKVLEQFPGGTRELIRESMDAPQPKTKVLEARSRILSRALSMAGEGRLSLGGAQAASEII